MFLSVVPSSEGLAFENKNIVANLPWRTSNQKKQPIKLFKVIKSKQILVWTCE